MLRISRDKTEHARYAPVPNHSKAGVVASFSVNDGVAKPRLWRREDYGAAVGGALRAGERFGGESFDSAATCFSSLAMRASSSLIP